VANDYAASLVADHPRGSGSWPRFPRMTELGADGLVLPTMRARRQHIVNAPPVSALTPRGTCRLLDPRLVLHVAVAALAVGGLHVAGQLPQRMHPPPYRPGDPLAGGPRIGCRPRRGGGVVGRQPLAEHPGVAPPVGVLPPHELTPRPAQLLLTHAQQCAGTVRRVKPSPEVAALAAVPLFSTCSGADLALLARVVEHVSYAAGEALMREGEHGEEFVVLLDGEAEVTRAGTPIATLLPGDFAGELSLLDPGPRTATVTATARVDALLLGGREFWSVVTSSPGLDAKLLVAMARRLKAEQGRP